MISNPSHKSYDTHLPLEPARSSQSPWYYSKEFQVQGKLYIFIILSVVLTFTARAFALLNRGKISETRSEWFAWALFSSLFPITLHVAFAFIELKINAERKRVVKEKAF